MGKLFTPQDISSGFNTTNSLNTNFDNIETALDRTLSRYADTPNAMESDLDMNNNDLINAGLVSCDTLEVGGAEIPTLQSLQDLLDATESTLDDKVVEASGYASNASLSASQSVTAQLAAEAAQEAAEDAAASVGLPLIGSGDAGKAIVVNALEDGYEYTDLTTDPDAAITSRLASKVEAEAGTDNTVLMTPLRTKESMKEQIEAGDYPGTSLLWGTFLAAPSGLTASALVGGDDTGTDYALTAGGLSQAIKVAATANKLQLGTMLIQWGVVGRTGSDTLVTFPIPFASVPTVVATCERTDNGYADSPSIGSTRTTTQVNFRSNTDANTINWVAFGEK